VSSPEVMFPASDPETTRSIRHSDAPQIETNDPLRPQIPPEIQVVRSFERPRTLRPTRRTRHDEASSAQLSPSAAPTQRSKQSTTQPFRSADTTKQAVHNSTLLQRRHDEAPSHQHYLLYPSSIRS